MFRFQTNHQLSIVPDIMCFKACLYMRCGDSCNTPCGDLSKEERARALSLWHVSWRCRRTFGAITKTSSCSGRRRVNDSRAMALASGSLDVSTRIVLDGHAGLHKSIIIRRRSARAYEDPRTGRAASLRASDALLEDHAHLRIPERRFYSTRTSLKRASARSMLAMRARNPTPNVHGATVATVFIVPLRMATARDAFLLYRRNGARNLSVRR